MSSGGLLHRVRSFSRNLWWAVVLWAGIGDGVSGRAAELKAGVARMDVTPPLTMKVALGGYGERMSQPATGVHDRVWAKALVLQDAGQRRAIVTADVLAFPPGLRDAVAQELTGDGWRPEDILLLASHSHTSFDLMALNPKNTFRLAPLGVFHAEARAFLVNRLAEVVRAASRTNQVVNVASGMRALPGWNRNRRSGQGVADPDLTLTRVDSAAGHPLAILVNWTAHPTFLDPRHMDFSGDWPGHLQRTLEALVGRGVTVLFYNGAEGDQSPTPRPNGGSAWEQAEVYGRDLALEAWRVWLDLRPQPNPEFAWQTGRFALPARSAHADFKKTGGAEYGLTDDNVGVLLETVCPTETVTTAVKLGDLVLAGVPGELAAGLGVSLKSEVQRLTGVKHVAVGGLANEWVSYLLSPEEYRRGGYEASMSFYGETVGPIVVTEVGKVAARLK